MRKGVLNARRTGNLHHTGASAQLLAHAGFVLPYGAELDGLQRRPIKRTHKILNGARPDELPVEQPTNFQLALNLAAVMAIDLAGRSPCYCAQTRLSIEAQIDRGR